MLLLRAKFCWVDSCYLSAKSLDYTKFTTHKSSINKRKHFCYFLNLWLMPQTLLQLSDSTIKIDMLLREKDRQTLVQIFLSTDTLLEVWAYGSRVNGTAHNGSDLDLVARSSDLKPLPIAVYADLSEKIRESNIPILVEFRDWARLPERFHRNIEQGFEVLFSNLETILNKPALVQQTKLMDHKKG